MTTPEPRQQELARAALDCEVIADAFRLADWLGPGRELTASGVLRPAVALQACQALGIPLTTGKLRSAKDVPRLQRAWESAAAADLVRITANRASAAPEAAALAAAAARADGAVGAASLDPEVAGQVVLAWLRAVGFQFGFPHDICGQCVSTLIELGQQDGPAEVIEVVMALLGEDDGDLDPSAMYLCPDCGQLHETSPSSPDPADGAEADHVLAAIEALTSFGAVATGPGRIPGGTVTLTSLGRLFAESALTSISPPPRP